MLPNEAVLLFTDSSGQYIPQRFAKEIDRSRISNVHEEDYDILKYGPEHDHYWDVWDSVLNDARLHQHGKEYCLYQDGDVWAVPVGSPNCDDHEHLEQLANYIAEHMDHDDLVEYVREGLYEEYKHDASRFYDHASSNPEAFIYRDEYADLPSHTKQALDAWVREGHMAGHFVTAVLENDLMKAMSHADTTNRNAIDVITKYVYNRLPSGCWGSPEKVRAWPAKLREACDA